MGMAFMAFMGIRLGITEQDGNYDHSNNRRLFVGHACFWSACFCLRKQNCRQVELVKLTINGEKEIEVEAGSTVLTTLSKAKIFLPSACGGGGTCAMCKCQITEGGGEILPNRSTILLP